jgi:hypothetical protein
MSSQNTSTTTTTTIFTLPSRDNEEEPVKYESFEDHRREGPAETPSPSVPWFLDYWFSSTFFDQPPFLLDQLCACQTRSTAVVFEGDGQDPERDGRFDLPTDHSWRLRRAVASHDESMYHDASTLLAGNNGGRDGIYPTKEHPYRCHPSIRKSSILYDEEDGDEDEDSIKERPQRQLNGSDSLLDRDHHDDDDDDHSLLEEKEVRDKEPASELSQSQEPQRDYSTTLLYSCNSFDCLSDHSVQPEEQVSHVRRRRMVGTPPRRFHPQQQRLLRPPASPSAQTYTTVSLSQSFMKEFDDMDGEDQSDEMMDNESLTMTSTVDFVKQWTEASSYLFRPKHDDGEGEQDDQDDNIYSTPRTVKKTVSPASSPPHLDRSQQPYRYLIRMRPQNYVHYDESSTSFSVEEEKKEDDTVDYEDFAYYNRYELPSHTQLKSDMTFYEAFFPAATASTEQL